MVSAERGNVHEEPGVSPVYGSPSNADIEGTKNNKVYDFRSGNENKKIEQYFNRKNTKRCKKRKNGLKSNN